MSRAPFRLAIRAEGLVINAYMARWETTADAHLLCSIARACCEVSPEVFVQFKALARSALAAIALEALNVEVKFLGEQAAPDHERAGRA